MSQGDTRIRRVLQGPASEDGPTADGWERRASQIAMAEGVAEHLEFGGELTVEAPTGTGKTLAYLVPAALSGRRVIVSTHTKNLQDQIVDKDLVLLRSLMEDLAVEESSAEPVSGAAQPTDTVRYALMKGRANYLCTERLARMRSQFSFGFESDASALDEIITWAKNTERGDRAELLGLADRSALWDSVDGRADTCTGQSCRSFEPCFVNRMRRRAAGADIIVVNHYLLMADAALRARQQMSARPYGMFELIPQADALIIDEAHALLDVAGEFFGGRVTLRMVELWRKDLNEAQSALTRFAYQESDNAAAGLEAVFAGLPKGAGREAKSRENLDQGRYAAWRTQSATDVAKIHDRMVACDEAFDVDGLESLRRRRDEILNVLSFVLEGSERRFVYWSESDAKQRALGATPLDAGRLLQTHLYPAFESVVMTSATLGTGGPARGRDAGAGPSNAEAETEADSLRFFVEAAGLNPEGSRMVLASPFDFSKQAALYLPKAAPLPTAMDATAKYAALIKELLDAVAGGALLLFTSYRVMHAVRSALGPLERPVYVQGEAPKQKLLQQFISGAPGVLFATASFWEGVDVPGAALELVTIDRLPFDAPNDPMLQAKAADYAAQGRNVFKEYQLPRAVLRLRQGFGRLIRTRTDRGVVAILDRRLQEKGYRHTFLDTLPDANRFDDYDALCTWYNASVAATPTAETPC